MNKQPWLSKVREHADDLRQLITRYHPVNLRPNASDDAMAASITAPQAERACERVRTMIRSESMERPDVQFNTAMQNEDVHAIASLLQSAWFGVPETTVCWQIPGFKVAVDLLDDPVDEPLEEVASAQ